MTEYLGLEKIRELKVRPAWRDWHWRRWLFAFAVFTALTTILVVDFLPDQITGIHPGKPSPKTVKAPRDIQIVDDEATAQRRIEAQKAIGKVYSRSIDAETHSTDQVHHVFSVARRLKDGKQLSPDDSYREATQELGLGLSRDRFDRMMALSVDQLSEAEMRTVTILERLYADQVTGDQLSATKDKLIKAAYDTGGDLALNQVVADAGTAYLVPNYIYNQERTERLKKDAAADVEPVLIQKQKGEEIVGEGKIVTAPQIKLLRELGLLGRRVDMTRLSGFALISFALMAAFAVYLHNYQRKIYDNGRLLLVLAIIMVGTALIGKVVISFSMLFLVPVVAAGMLTTLLFNAELATAVVTTTALYSGLLAGQDYRFVLIWLVGGLFAIYTVWHINHRTDLARAGALVSLVMGGLAVATAFLSSSVAFADIFNNLMWGLAGGLVASVLTIGVLPFLEKVFGITTDIRLVELSYANQPMLRQLMMNAPGTYTHSVMTGNLAESAAELVGAKPLLARVGAYYHDIGKMKRPLYFIENQIGGENQHDHTNPNLSCLIITSHVKEGVEMAEKEDLPKEIIDIIREHHGTSIVTYFYHRAKENLVKEEVYEADFRYPGSKPRSREAALVMLADSVEAAARAIAKPTPNRLEQVIRRVVQQKIDDGQLSESDLTLKDIDTIMRSFTQVLGSIYHTRVEYPLPAVPIRSANGNLVK
ncbi:MAG: HDIG domain-containing protein [Chloroflexi bacterium]|nr:HDIG domain-containing protein [Chloroflexota bacterium]